MKKYVFIISILLLSVFVINVNAASVPYNWIVNGEEIRGTANSSNTALLTKEGNVVTLKLQNYSGKGIELNCYGTGQAGITFIIELSGENVITDENVGINFNYDGKIEFKGDGSLKINAPKPISYEAYENTMIIKPGESIYTDNVEALDKDISDSTLDEEIKNEEVKDEETLTEKNDVLEDVESENNSINIFLITTIVLGVIALIELVYIIVKKNKKA